MMSKRRPFAGAVATVLLAGAMAVSPASAAGRPGCLVSNDRTRQGSTSLQSAIDAASAGDTLIVKGTCLGTGAILGRNASFVIDRDLTLKGVANKAFGTPTLDGGLNGGVVWVSGGTTVTLIGLTITNGFSGTSNGGGLFNDGGAVALIDSTVSANYAWVAGGIENSFRGTMTLTNSTVSNNTSHAGGGGIYNAGTLTLASSTVRDNTSLFSGAGGIFNFRVDIVPNSGFLSVTNSTISGNSALEGGGILNQGAPFGLGLLSVNSSTISDNTANFGGGILNLGTAAIADSMVSHNATVAVGGFGGYGAGIVNARGFSSAPATLTVVNSAIRGNTATAGNGGGIVNGFFSGEANVLTLTGSTVIGNSAAFNGGGIFNRGLLTVAGSAVTGNVANSGAGIFTDGALTMAAPDSTIGGNAAATSGGGIWNSGGIVTGGCPTSLGGNVIYSPANSPTDYNGFSCPMPVPHLATNGTEDYIGSDGNPYTRYRLTITNWESYAPELFVQAPDLAPCGLNSSASRTWVDIYSAPSGTRIYGFCALSAPSDLTQIWFAQPRGTTPPSGVYVTLTDRRTGQTVTSNIVSP